MCNAVHPSNDKLRHAQLWGVPAVTAEWLWDCIRLGDILPFDAYLVQPVNDPSKVSTVSKTVEMPENPARAPSRNEKQTEAAERWIPKPLEKSLLSDEEKNQFAKDAPPRRGPAKAEKSPRPETHSDLLSKPPLKDEVETPIYLDGDDTPVLFDDSTTTFDPPQISPALREITPNSSPPKPSLFPPKENPLSPPRKQSEDPTLGPAISSLLAHHQRTNSAAARPISSESSDQPRLYRRRRQLLGRAPSNLSSHSINLSRASSVDTMNTDGLGTPLEPSNKSKSDFDLERKARTDFPTFYSADQNDDPDREEPPLQLTQLGYEDPDVAAWRERVAVKMAGGKVKGGTTPGKGKGAGAGVGAGAVGGGGLGIAKRTRLASGAR